MRIYHNKKILCYNAKVYRSFLTKAKGLMFSRNFKGFDGLLFVNRFESKAYSSVHSFFVFFPIDIVWLDKDLKVVDKKTLRPFTLHYTPSHKAKYFLELPSGRSQNLKLGSKLSFSD